VEGSARGAQLRIVQLSDLHLKAIEDVHERVAEQVDALSPDLLAFTGDTVDDPGNLPLLDEFLGLFRTRAAKLAVMGNWEYQGGVSAAALSRAFELRGGELLVNRTVTVSLGGGDLVVTGLDDWLRGRPDPGAALVGIPEGPGRQGHHLVLAHCPAQRDELVARRSPAGAPIPWMLSGHTHGGQIGLPGMRVTPLGSADYVRGWYRASTPNLYVSRGIGTSVVPIRIGSRPEVAVFDVQLA
jgi:predicted MPP superfamily phosphohydrolase